MRRISGRSKGKFVATAIAAVATAAAAVVASAEPPAGAASCSGCHPASTRVTTPVPRLVGVEQAAIVRAFLEFRAGQRPATVMDRIAKGFTDDEIRALAAWFATQK